MLNPNLKLKYKTTKKVMAPEWRHVTLGLINLATISDGMAEKLCRKGYLVRVEEEKPEPAAPKKKARKGL